MDWMDFPPQKDARRNTEDVRICSNVTARRMHRCVYRRFVDVHGQHPRYTDPNRGSTT